MKIHTLFSAIANMLFIYYECYCQLGLCYRTMTDAGPMITGHHFDFVMFYVYYSWENKRISWYVIDPDKHE